MVRGTQSWDMMWQTLLAESLVLFPVTCLLGKKVFSGVSGWGQGQVGTLPYRGSHNWPSLSGNHLPLDQLLI